jgi:hypothetical protein
VLLHIIIYPVPRPICRRAGQAKTLVSVTPSLSPHKKDRDKTAADSPPRQEARFSYGLPAPLCQRSPARGIYPLRPTRGGHWTPLSTQQISRNAIQAFDRQPASVSPGGVNEIQLEYLERQRDTHGPEDTPPLQ